MPYRCPAIHVYKNDYVLTGDGYVRIYLKHCCPYSVETDATLCKKHQNRMIERFKHNKLCQWNYAYNHGLVYGPQNPLSHTTGGVWYNYIIENHGAPKKDDLERLQKAEASACEVSKLMQKKITDYSITPIFVKKSTAIPQNEVKTPRGRKPAKKKNKDDNDSISSNSSTATTVSTPKIPENKQIFVPKGPIITYEKNCAPLIVDSIEYETDDSNSL